MALQVSANGRSVDLRQWLAEKAALFRDVQDDMTKAMQVLDKARISGIFIGVLETRYTECVALYELAGLFCKDVETISPVLQSLSAGDVKFYITWITSGLTRVREHLAKLVKRISPDT